MNSVKEIEVVSNFFSHYSLQIWKCEMKDTVTYVGSVTANDTD